MRDRLRSLKFFRTMRNLFFCLSAVCLLEMIFLLFNLLVHGQRVLFPVVIFLAFSIFFAYLSYYYHGRFRCRE